MSIVRYDIDNCIGCKICYKICPMDVFRFNETIQKSVIAYPENCISCGECFVNCPGHSLAITNEAFGHTLTSFRAPPKYGMSRKVLIPEVD